LLDNRPHDRDDEDEGNVLRNHLRVIVASIVCRSAVVENSYMRSLNCWNPHQKIALCLVIGAFTLSPLSVASGQGTPLTKIGDATLAAEGAAEDEGVAIGLADWINKYPGITAAKENLEAGNTTEAIRQLVLAAENNPELPQAEVILAEFYFAVKNPAAAVAALDRAAQNQPEDPEPYLILGNLAFTQNRNTDARVLFEKAATLVGSLKVPREKRDRIMLRLHAGLASVSERASEWSKAIPHLEAWVKIDPQKPAAHLRLARALFRTKQGRKAYVQAQKASELSDTFAKAPVLIAQFYSETGKDELAEKWLGEAEKRYGDDLNTRLVLAEREWQRGRLAHARRHVTAASEIDPSSARAALLAGMVAHLENDYATAQKNFELARESAPDDFGPRNHLAMVLAAQEDSDKVEEALRLAQANREDFPQSAVAAATLGFIQLQLGQTVEAAKNLQLAGSAGRGTGDMAYFFAKFWATQGEKERARNVLGQVLNSSNKSLFVFRKDAEQLYEQLGKR
jgi:tetratricopeptide (TPR) repeat protein